MYVAKVRVCAKPVHNRMDFAFRLSDNCKPDIVFVGTDVIVGNRRNFVDRSRKSINIGNLARTKTRNKTEPTGIVHSTDTADNTRLAQTLDRSKSALLIGAKPPRQYLVRVLLQREGFLNDREKTLFKFSHIQCEVRSEKLIDN